MRCSKLRFVVKRIAAALLLLSGWQSMALIAQNSSNTERAAIEIIAIEHRDPLYVRAQLISALDPRGHIALVDNKLIVASTGGNLQQLKNIIADTDVPARRLVVSVDFEYGNTRPGNANQQSTQALEGDEVSFSDDGPDTLPGIADDGQDVSLPGLTINSLIRGDSVDANVEIVNVPGFSGNHELNLVLGQWYVINPTPDANENVGMMMDVDNSDATAAAQFTLINEPEPPALDLAPIAVRVDVLP